MAASGSASQRRIRDKERASFLKKIGEERVTGVCPICYRSINIGKPQQPTHQMENHLRTCGGK